ncbi:methyltransferase [Marinomonas balearica]|uniref:Methyltransferase family protein n=1 Tax=Marinomonas balearica TaxID=491947 RepID=A0A4R6M4N4_9GAMM|nr:methyltransferase [Marinomonas balearica]TDO96267.1 methyltransferase family protein [Marinomonas balearica]
MFTKNSPLTEQFLTLDRWLTKTQPLWQVASFASMDWPWRTVFPELTAHLENNTTLGSTAQSIEATLLETVRDFTPAPKIPLHDFIATQQSELPSYFKSGIKGRKWTQIDRFSKLVPQSDSTLEWCAGKGHLGKAIAYRNSTKVVSLEWQQALCDAGEDCARKLNLDQTFVCADVLNSDTTPTLKRVTSAVALHACGDLHRILIEQGLECGIGAFTVSPCCYHLTQEDIYTPLSQTARQSHLSLNKNDLRLAVKEIATAGQREQHHRARELSYRLGFDAWQRAFRNTDEYLPLSKAPDAIMRQGFEAYCQWAAKEKQLTLPTNAQLTGYETIGEQRKSKVLKIEAVTQYFRRPLELWLVLDRALRLEEAGYTVEVGEFCDKSTTPRNLLIRAIDSNN